MPITAAHVPALLDALVRSDPGRPRLTWYGDGDERVELSARVLANWVAKSANLLTEEFDAGPGVTVSLDLPADHWKTLVLELAVPATGAVVRTGGEVTVSNDPPADVVVALPALARRYDGEPGEALDYAAVITGYDDVFLPATPDTGWLREAAAAFTPVDGARLLVPTGTPDVAHRFASALLGDGSFVVAAAGADLERVAEQEGATPVID